MALTFTKAILISKKATFVNIKIGKETIKIAVPPELWQEFKHQFVRPNPSPLQKRKMATIKKLMRAAYEAGQESA